MIDPLVKLPIVKQCELLDLSRSTYYYVPLGESEDNLELMEKIDRIYMEHPFWDHDRSQSHVLTVHSTT